MGRLLGATGCGRLPGRARNFATPSCVAVASDDMGMDLKIAIVEHLRSQGMVVQDLGNSSEYHAAAASVAKAVQDGGATCRGMLFSGTGVGAVILANKFRGIYAAVAENE